MWPARSLRIVRGHVEPRLSSTAAPLGLWRIVVLIHGYNNDREQAAASYAAFLQRMRAHLDPAKQASIWTFFWPGYVRALVPRLGSSDEAWTEGNALLTAPLYSRQVPKAEAAGIALGNYLLRLRGQRGVPTEVILIAHSLGCRVALEAVREFFRRAQVQRVKSVSLMAAAVPVYMVRAGGHLRSPARLTANSQVLHSKKDTVLKWCFPPGQTLAGEGIKPRAVGLRGEPHGLWAARYDTQLRHGDYWRHRKTTPYLAKVFGVVVRRTLHEFPVTSWELPPAARLPENVLVRSTPTSDRT